MKKCTGKCWKYKNSPARGITAAAELTVHGGGAMFTAYGQKTMKSAIMAANKAAKKLGWKMVDPWEHIADK